MKIQEIQMDNQTKKRIEAWMETPYDKTTRNEVKKLYEECKTKAIDAFYKHLNFGTGGLRGLMGVGTNRINLYTIATATQGVANYLKKLNPSKKLTVFIGYDSRHLSKAFAEETAKVFASNQIHVYLEDDIKPTPLISFGCRFKKCDAAIMITASHNKKEYNGYKVYWNDGAQVLAPHDLNIMKEIEDIKNLSQVKREALLTNPLIEYVGKNVEEAYLDAIAKLQLSPLENKKKGDKIEVIYTSLHGTGMALFPEASKKWGFTNITYVKKQCVPDGDFPTLTTPNPEEKEALLLGIDLLEKTNKDLLIAHDPDGDRMSVALLHKGKTVILSGNQIACLLLSHILKTLSEFKKLPENGAFIKTIVTTELFKKIALSYHKECFNVVPGFKYIGQKIREWETALNAPKYLFGVEESYGYLFGTDVRDKDAISTSMLMIELALQAKQEGKTLVNQLYEIYEKFGCFVEKVISIGFEDSKAGKEAIKKRMDKLKKNPPKKVGNYAVKEIENYEESIKLNLLTKEATKLSLPKADVLILSLEDESRLIVRPSGTEPKIKIYGEVLIKNFINIQSALKEGEKKVTELIQDLEKIVNLS